MTSATSGSLTYTYLSDGTKVSAIRSDGSGKRYVGSMVYSVPASGDGSEVFESASWDEGRVGFTKSGTTYTLTDLWFVKDHLGNVRTVVDVSPGLSSPQVMERNDYLPYGTRMVAGQATLEANRYRLGGKEEQVFGGLDLGKVDFGARMYDPFTARWATQDPMAAKYAGMSPYSYCAGNPIGIIDLDGKIPRIYIQRNGLGHVFVTTGEGNNTTVYTYGRYGALYKFFGSITSGSLTPLGEGVLGILKGKDAANYLGSVIKDKFDVFELKNGDDSNIDDYFSQIIQGCDTPSNPNKITYHNDLYHVIDLYNLLSNNCVTTSRKAAEKGGVQINSKSSIPIVFDKGLSDQSTNDTQIKKVEYPEALVHYILYMIDHLNNNDNEN